DAFAEARPFLRDGRLLIVGYDSAEQEERVRGYVSSRGLPEAVRILGYREEIEEIMAVCDVTVDASWDGTGITGTIRESMSVGTPVIATDCGGNREILHDPDLGWLIPPSDHERLVAAILDVASNPERAAEVSENASRYVRDTFSIDRRIDRIETIYRACVAQRRGTTEPAGIPSDPE
ncbi:MAG: glycosyltransferase family 4 protein, partial [Thermoanaerobaculia bacterium]|nr:glycosyltransferase family 4 protein [Thermoanaerobaculia bacterium]